MKKILSLIISIMICAVFTSTAGAQQEIEVYINGNKMISDVPAVIVNGRIMLPFRAILNALDVMDEDVQWNQNSQSIEVRNQGKYIFLAIGSPGAIVDNNLILLDAVPYIANGRTLIPVRFISEALGASVYWNGDNKTVTIQK